MEVVRAAEPDDPMYRGLVGHAHYRCGTSFLRLGGRAICVNLRLGCLGVDLY